MQSNYNKERKKERKKEIKKERRKEKIKMDKFGHKWGWADSKWNKIFARKHLKQLKKSSLLLILILKQNQYDT